MYWRQETLLVLFYLELNYQLNSDIQIQNKDNMSMELLNVVFQILVL